MSRDICDIRALGAIELALQVGATNADKLKLIESIMSEAGDTSYQEEAVTAEFVSHVKSLGGTFALDWSPTAALASNTTQTQPENDRGH